MSINIDKVMEHIDRIGVDEANKRLDSYPKVGPTAEEFFGTEAVENVQKEIEDAFDQ